MVSVPLLIISPMKNNRLWFLCVCTVLLCQTSSLWSKTLNVVTDFGADNTGATYATVNIQNAIDACQPGDTLLIPPGTFLLNNGLTLKSDLTVHLSSNALLQANLVGVWLNNKSPILHGTNLNNVTVEGGGKIDGGGLVYVRQSKGVTPGRGMEFDECTNVTVRNVSVSNIPNFATDFQNSQNLTLESLTIRGRGFDGLQGSADGMDIESCVNVAISHCDIEVGDDALCLKVVDSQHPCHNIRVHNCTLATTCNAFKIGTNTEANVYDVVAENIVINKHSNPGYSSPVPSGDCIAAIALESNDHYSTNSIICRNFTVNSCYCPIFIELQNRQSVQAGDIGNLDNILIENFNCLRSLQPIIFNWQCGGANKMTNVTLSNVTVHDYGTSAGAVLSCMRGAYPDANQNGTANAYGIFARGLTGLTLKCVNLYDAGGSKRAKFVFDDTVDNVDMSAIDDCAVTQP